MNNDMKWKPIETAPKDRPILAWCDHEADPYYEPAKPVESLNFSQLLNQTSERLTVYAANCEAFSHAPTGCHIIEWGGGYTESEEYGMSTVVMPDSWFVAGSDFEVAANPLYWLDIDLSVVPTISQ